MSRNGVPGAPAGPAPPPGERFRFGDVEVDVPAMRVLRAGEPVELEPKIFDLLVFLAANRDRVVGKEEILERVWQGAFVTDNALARAVAQLRRALGDDAGNARYIETVRTRGYRFVAAVVALSGGGPPGERGAATPAEPPPPAPAGRRLFSGGRAVALAIAVLVLVTVAFAADQLLRANRVGVARRAAAVGGTPRQLTVAAAFDGGPTFSPDGRHLAFASERGEGAELSPEIVVRRLDDGEELEITSDGTGNVDPAWAPDDRWIAYHSMGNGGLWLVSPLGGTPRRLTEFGSQPAWSPDSRSVVFVSQPTTALAPWAWAASRDSQLWVIDVASGALRQLTQAGRPAGGHGEPAWSPDGRWIVFSAGDLLGRSTLWRVAAGGALSRSEGPNAGDEPAEIEASVGKAAEKLDWRSPVFVAAAEVIAVRSTRGYSVWRMPLWGDGTATEVLPVAPEGIGALAVSTDGSRLAFATHAVASRIASVAIGPGGEVVGEPQTLLASAQRVSHPRWSPDGATVLFTRARGGTSPDVIVHDLERRDELVLEGLEGPVQWASPSRLVMLGVAGGVSIDLETGQRRALELPESWVAGGERYQASFRDATPELDAVVFGARPQDAPQALELFVWPASETGPRQLTRFGAVAEYPSWSSDRRRLVFQVSREEKPEHDELWTVDVAGGEPRRLLRERGRSWGPRLDPAGRRAVYAAQRAGRWDLGIVAEGEPERLLGVNRSYTAYVRWPDWSPRGDRIVFEHTRMTADVWVMPLGAERSAAGAE